MPPSKSDVICCVPQCSSRANQQENISLHAPPKCMILRTSTTCGNFFKYFSIFRSGLGTGQWRRIARGKGTYANAPSQKFRGSKRSLTPDLSRPCCWLGLATILFFRRWVFIYALAFLAVFCSFFRHCFLYLKKKRDERSRALIQTRLAEPVSSQAEPRVNHKLSTNQTLS